MTWPRPPTPVRRWVMNVQGWNKFRPGPGEAEDSSDCGNPRLQRRSGLTREVKALRFHAGVPKLADVAMRLWRAVHPVPPIRAIRHTPDTGPAPTANGYAEAC